MPAPQSSRISLKLLAALALALGLAFSAVPGARAMGTGGEVTPASGPESDAYAAGKKAIDAKDWKVALDHLAKVGEKDPNRANALNYQGFANRKLGNYDAAFRFYEQALALEPMHKGAHEYLGEAYLETKNLPKAEGELAKLNALCPGGCEEQEDLEKAVAAYKKQNGA